MKPESLFSRVNREQKKLIEFVDGLRAKGKNRSQIEDAIYEAYHDEDAKEYYCLAYLSSLDMPEEEAEGQETDEEQEDDESVFETAFIDAILNDRPTEAICCEVNTERDRYTVKKSDEKIELRRQLFVHIEAYPPHEIEDSELELKVTTLRGEKTVYAMFDRDDRQGGGGFQMKPFPLTELFDDDYTLDEDEEDAIVVVFFYDGAVRETKRIPFSGCWPTHTTPYETVEKERLPDGGTTAKEQLFSINQFPGWANFKARMEEMYARHEVGEIRKGHGYVRLRPNLHSVIIGNPGTGKSSAATFMASLYHALGYLDKEEVVVTRVSKLVGGTINSETEALLSVVSQSEGGALIFEDAQDLYNPDTKNSYNSEQRILRTLIDEVSDRKKHPHWMVILVGELEGMESLLGANPDLKKSFTEPIYMEDFIPQELFWMVDACCRGRNLEFTPEARKKLEAYILHKYNHRGPGFENAYLVHRLFDNQIVPALYNRLNLVTNPTDSQLVTVEPEDIPAVSDGCESGMAELDELIGLGKIKTKVRDYLSAVRLAGRRMEMGLPTNMPRLHMAFLGNPGTGKTTVAEIIGKVFASWGILSGGRVIRTEKSQMVGQYIGETEFKMRNLLARARGNILFIDEAYQLVEGTEQDYGRIVMNSLLTELGKDNLDMVVILAGYTAPMKRLMESNEGIESRFPNVFNFEDYTTDELVDIGKLMIRKQGFVLTPGAEEKMRAVIEDESSTPSSRFGNGRFVSNLLQNEILSTLGRRTMLLENPTPEQLSTILPEDVIIGKAQKDVVFDDAAIDAALARLDALVGMQNVKAAIHNFVKSARYLHSIGEPYVGKGLLSWRFIGKTGTGKSTVAEIMAAILKGMRLISNSHITQVKGERVFDVPSHECDEVLREAVKKACNGLIFINGDAPREEGGRFSYGRSVEQIRLKIGELTVEAGGECALVLAELESPNTSVVEQLSESGIYEFDHTLVFKDFTPDELFEILAGCLTKYQVTFTQPAEEHMRNYLASIPGADVANARTMKLMSRTIYQQVILREAAMSLRPKTHQVRLEDVAMYKWNGHKGKIGF